MEDCGTTHRDGAVTRPALVPELSVSDLSTSIAFYLDLLGFQIDDVDRVNHHLIRQVDHDAWLKYTASLARTPGGASMWPHVEAVITPTIQNLINDEIARYPDDPSMIELVPLFKHDAAGEGEVESH